MQSRCWPRLQSHLKVQMKKNLSSAITWWLAPFNPLLTMYWGPQFLLALGWGHSLSFLLCTVLHRAVHKVTADFSWSESEERVPWLYRLKINHRRDLNKSIILSYLHSKRFSGLRSSRKLSIRIIIISPMPPISIAIANTEIVEQTCSGCLPGWVALREFLHI